MADFQEGKQINTEGGTYAGGNLSVGRDFVGRYKIINLFRRGSHEDEKGKRLIIWAAIAGIASSVIVIVGFISGFILPIDPVALYSNRIESWFSNKAALIQNLENLPEVVGQFGLTIEPEALDGLYFHVVADPPKDLAPVIPTVFDSIRTRIMKLVLDLTDPADIDLMNPPTPVDLKIADRLIPAARHYLQNRFSVDTGPGLTDEGKEQLIHKLQKGYFFSLTGHKCFEDDHNIRANFYTIDKTELTFGVRGLTCPPKITLVSAKFSADNELSFNLDVTNESDHSLRLLDKAALYVASIAFIEGGCALVEDHMGGRDYFELVVDSWEANNAVGMTVEIGGSKSMTLRTSDNDIDELLDKLKQPIDIDLFEVDSLWRRWDPFMVCLALRFEQLDEFGPDFYWVTPLPLLIVDDDRDGKPEALMNLGDSVRELQR